jgi:hypothetical protein
MLELLVDGEIIKFIHVLQKPQIVMQSLSLGIIHHLTDVQEFHVDCVHVHVLSLILLKTEVRFLERCFEDIVSIILHSVLGDQLN